MNQYGRVALKAYEILVNNEVDCSKKAWRKALEVEKVTDKECPKNTFIGLSEAKLLKNCIGPRIPLGQDKNKNYAIIAVRILKIDGLISKNDLLHKMIEKIGYLKTQYGNVADVVLALWEKKYIEENNIDLIK